jgi:hypothetical protein
MYDYTSERPWLFTDEGQRVFIAFRDVALKKLSDTGACTIGSALSWIRGAPDSWKQLACIDRMVELGDVRKVERPGHATQSQVLVVS